MEHSCDPPLGRTAFLTIGSRGTSRLTGASAKGRSAAVRTPQG